MKAQNYNTQDGAIHNGYAHIASLALIDLIAEANKRLDSRVTDHPPEWSQHFPCTDQGPRAVNSRSKLKSSY